jgi:hypothetical protein
VAALYLMQKTRYRYLQAERAAAETAVVLEQGAARVGLSYLSGLLIAGFNGLTVAIGKFARAAVTRTVAVAFELPLIGSIVSRYCAHYDGVEPAYAERFSKKASGFFARWSIKFSAEYYEAKEREEAAKRLALQTAAMRPAPVRPHAGG